MKTSKQRVSRRIISGAPSPHAELETKLIPAVGRALLVLLARLVAAEARKQFSGAARKVHVSATKENKKVVTDWFLVEKLVRSVAKDLSADTATPTLPDAKVKPADIWRAYAAVSTWALRESETVRLGDMHTPAPVFSTPQRRTFRRERPRKDMAAYTALRTPLTGAPESQGNNPWLVLHRAITSAMPAVKNSTTPRAFPGSLGKALDAGTWPAKGLWFEKLPMPSRVVLVLGKLISLRPHGGIRRHTLDFQVEPVVRRLVAEATYRAFAARAVDVRGLKGPIVRNVRAAVAFQAAQSFLSALSIAAGKLARPPDAVVQAVNSASKRAAGRLPRKHIDELLLTTDPTARGSAASFLVRRVLDTIARSTASTLKAHGFESGWPRAQKRAELAAGRLESLMNLVLTMAAGDVTVDAFAVLAVLESDVQLVSVYVGELLAAAEDWSVALPVLGLTCEDARLVRPVGLTTIETVQASWKKSITDRPSAYIRGPSVHAFCIERTVKAHSSMDAVAEALGLSDLDLSYFWFIAGAADNISLYRGALVRGPRGTTGITTVAEDGLRPGRILHGSELRDVVSAAEQLQSMKANAKSSELVERWMSAASFFRASRSSGRADQSYLFLWLSLETLLSNLHHDSNEYESAVPIGERVGYRAAVLGGMRGDMAGLSYADARWACALELQTLYKIRCKVVHEGLRTPTANDHVLSRFTDLVANVLAVVLDGLDGGARSLEELLAFYERVEPGARVVP